MPEIIGILFLSSKCFSAFLKVRFTFFRDHFKISFLVFFPNFILFYRRRCWRRWCQLLFWAAPPFISRNGVQECWSLTKLARHWCRFERVFLIESAIDAIHWDKTRQIGRSRWFGRCFQQSIWNCNWGLWWILLGWIDCRVKWQEQSSCRLSKG